jgi:hypothetical protein
MPTLWKVSRREGEGMRYYLTISKDGSELKTSPYWDTYEIDEKFHSELKRVMFGLIDARRAKQL